MKYWIGRFLVAAIVIAVICIVTLWLLKWKWIEIVLPVAGFCMVAAAAGCYKRYGKRKSIHGRGVCRAANFNVNDMDISWCDAQTGRLKRERFLELHPDRNRSCGDVANKATQDAQNQCEYLFEDTYGEDNDHGSGWKSWDDHMKERENAPPEPDEWTEHLKREEAARNHWYNGFSVMSEVLFAFSVMGEGTLFIAEILGTVAIEGLSLAADGVVGLSEWLLDSE